MFERNESWQKYGGQGVIVKCPGCGYWAHIETHGIGYGGRLLSLFDCEKNGRRYAIRLVGWPNG